MDCELATNKNPSLEGDRHVSSGFLTQKDERESAKTKVEHRLARFDEYLLEYSMPVNEYHFFEQAAVAVLENKRSADKIAQEAQSEDAV